MRTTLRKTGSVVTRAMDRDRRDEGRVHKRFHENTVVASGIITGGGSRRRTRHFSSCFSFSRPLGEYSSRQLLTVHHNRTTNFLHVDVSTSSRRYRGGLGHRCMRKCNRYRALMNRTISSTFGHLLGPDVRARFTTLDGRGTSRRTVIIFTRGLHRLLLTTPLNRGQIVTISPNFTGNYGAYYLSTRNGLVRRRVIFPRPPHGGGDRTATTVRHVIGVCRIRTVTINGNATDHRADS